jgi:uncharacterized protein YycO
MTFKTANPLPGDFGLVHIEGWSGKAISLGQRLVGSASYFSHAFVVIDSGNVVEAEPGGAIQSTLSDAVGNRRVAYSDFALDGVQRARIVSAAIDLIGTPYSFVDYAAIGAVRLLHFGLIEDYVSDSRHMICSQLVDECYGLAGIELFPHRACGNVTPGDLARLIGAI